VLQPRSVPKPEHANGRRRKWGLRCRDWRGSAFSGVAKLTRNAELPGFLPRRAENAQTPRLLGWGGRNRTSVWRNQNPLPYRLATPHRRDCSIVPPNQEAAHLTGKAMRPQPGGGRRLRRRHGLGDVLEIPAIGSREAVAQ